jgi:ferredoxin
MNGDNGVRFTVSKNCTLCGTCAKACPSGNIKVGEKVSFGDKCEFCLACAHHCPQNAIHVKGERNSARWRHPDVTLMEIISANNRTQ